MEKKTIFQETYKINDLNAIANRTSRGLSEIVAKLQEMTGTTPDEVEITDFANGGHLISIKLDECTRADAMNFRSSSAKTAFETALKTEQKKLSELKYEFMEILSNSRMSIQNFELKGLTLILKQTYLDAVLEQHTCKITEGSIRSKIFELTQTAVEVLSELKSEIKKSGVNISPVETPSIDSPKGLIFIPDDETSPSIELENFFLFPDE
jgi:hypothetical protein